ncbi:MAG: amidohydrolase [Sphingomonas sp.]|uniref:amidohydrolase family protein n=1 Tax=Sphingomonas sp. TaxID=28214 RepID=UPI001AD0570C|nr:amidohydrolase family protein [Sphingomonas sp.]MBN8816330.1 amidohydrolase [Sphingomonas sp.]
MIIDCHGHYTTAPSAHNGWRQRQKAAFLTGEGSPRYPAISDDEIRETLEANQLRLLRERGADMTIFSPRASAMAPHVGDENVAKAWARANNDLIRRCADLYSDIFAPVCMLPQNPRADMAGSIEELDRCVSELGFIGCNLNPDPGGGDFTAPPLTDRFWYPFYEKMIELNVPAMIHVSGSCNPGLHATGAYYIAADTIAFMQLIEGDLFADFPTLRFIIPHGGGAVPYHWGRYRGLADMLQRPDLGTHVMNNVFFDTCVYHQPGIDLLARVIETKNILFGSEMVGAVRGVDPTTGQYFDDTRRYVDALPISDAQRHAIFEGNARRVFPRLDAMLKALGK